MRYSMGLFFLFAASVINAAPLVWTLNDVTFEDGGLATGSFTYDADTGSYSSISIQTTACTGAMCNFPGKSYGIFNANTQAGEDLIVYESNPADVIFFLHGLNLDWQGELSNSGGNIALLTAGTSHEIWVQALELREVTGGTLSAVPVPAALWLFGSALAGLGWLRRK